VEEAGYYQHQGHQRPWNLLLALGQKLVKSRYQPQSIQQLSCQPRTPKLKTPLDANPLYVNFNPPGLDIVKQLSLITTMVCCCGGLPDTQASGLIQLSQICYRPLAGTSLGAIRFDQCPIGVAFTILVDMDRPDEHARILEAAGTAATQ